MASSGSFNTSKYGDRYLKFSWSIKSQSIANNTTTISWSLTGAGGATNFYYQAGNFKVVINGSTVYSSSTRINLYNGTKVASGTATISHNSDGTKTFSASAQAGIYTVDVNCKGSGSWSLTTIPRYATSVQALKSKTETSITMNWSSDKTIDYIWYSIDNGSSWTSKNVTDGTSGSYTVSGLKANTTYKVKTRVRNKSSQLTTDSSALSVTTYNYPYCNSMPSFTIGDTLKLGFYNPLGRSITFYIIANGTQIANSWSISGTSYSGVNATSSQTQLYNTIPNSKSATYQVKCVYGSSTITKTGGTYKANETACRPTISSISYLDNNSKTTAITENNQLIIRNNSNVVFTITGINALYGATLKSVKVDINSVSKSASLSGSSVSSSTVNFGVVNVSQNIKAYVTITDSRGITNVTDVTLSILNWQPPTAIISLQRQQNFYSQTDLTVNADCTSLNDKNSVTIQYQYKKVADTSYSALQTIANNTLTTFTADNSYQWNVKVIVTDLLGSTTYNLTLDKGIPIIFFDRILKSTGFNCFPTEEESVAIGGKTVQQLILDTAYPVGSVYTNGSNTNPSTTIGGNWFLFDKKLANKVLSSGFFAANSTNFTISSTSALVCDDSIRIRIYGTFNVALADSTIALGTINYANLGITKPLNDIYIVAYSDGGNAILMMILRENGTLENHDVVIKGTGTSVTSGYNGLIDFWIPVDYANKLDSACDRFLFERSA